MASMIGDIAVQLETQSLNSVVAGFSFASALGWYAVVKTLVAMTVKAGKDGIQHDLMSAVVTTLLAIIVFLVVKALARNIKINEPSQTVFAVTR